MNVQSTYDGHRDLLKLQGQLPNTPILVASELRGLASERRKHPHQLNQAHTTRCMPLWSGFGRGIADRSALWSGVRVKHGPIAAVREMTVNVGPVTG